MVISSISLAALSCSQRHGKRKEEWTARDELDANDWIKILGILQKNSSTIKTNTLVAVARGRRYKHGALSSNIMEQFSVSLPH